MAAQTRRNTRTYDNRTSGRRENIYVYDNTARDLEIRRQFEEAPKAPANKGVQKNREKARHMNLGYVAFLVAALGICAMILINYIQLQSQITDKVRNIARQESRLNSIQLKNDDTYNKIVSSIDLEEIKKVAIGELGMTYAREGQIIRYADTGSDYMRKVSE